jgi:competence protein ComEC
MAAFFMLLYNPFYLYDIGFQLSFISVISILMFYRHFQSLCPSSHALVCSVWSMMSVSMAAQLGTAPWVMYYFSNFSVYFLLANIGVALWVPCILYMAFATMLMDWYPWIHGWMVRGLDFMVGTLNALAGCISEWPYAVWSSARLHPLEVWVIYGVLGALGYHLTIRHRGSFFMLLVSLAVWLALHCWLLLK